jgi:hypothetical protein
MYETGQGGLVPKNEPVARRLYAAAAGHGMKEAQARLDQMGPEPPMTPAPEGPVPPPPTRPAGASQPISTVAP